VYVPGSRSTVISDVPFVPTTGPFSSNPPALTAMLCWIGDGFGDRRVTSPAAAVAFVALP
jgi:hypothetical protein